MRTTAAILGALATTVGIFKGAFVFLRLNLGWIEYEGHPVDFLNFAVVSTELAAVLLCAGALVGSLLLLDRSIKIGVYLMGASAVGLVIAIFAQPFFVMAGGIDGVPIGLSSGAAVPSMYWWLYSMLPAVVLLAASGLGLRVLGTRQGLLGSALSRSG